MQARSVRLADIAAQLGGEVVGDPETRVSQVATLKSAGPEHISFFAQGRYREELQATRAGAVIVSAEERDATTLPRIVCADPYLYFAQVSRLLNPPAPVQPGVHPSAVIDASAFIDPTAHIGPGCVIEAGANIGPGVAVGAGCIVGARSTIGEGSRLYPRVTIYADCVIGRRAIIHSGAVIGADGFGFAQQQGRWLKIPQIGRVVIGDDVEIGANTTIDRGALGDTVVEEGVKLDNQIQIGHNVRIGAHTAIAGATAIAGSTTIGKRCTIAGAVGFAGHLHIADGTVITGMTAVSRSINKAGIYSSGTQMVDNHTWRKSAVRFNQLDEMYRRLRELETELADLKAQLNKDS